jgi:serine/threonine protein kinase
MANLYIGDADAPAEQRTELLHTTCGTPNYVAPEVLTSQGYDGQKADIWSMGVILFVFLAGYLPFEEGTTTALFKKIKAADFKYPVWFSSPSRKLIDAILRIDPDVRLSLVEMRKSAWMTTGQAMSIKGTELIIKPNNRSSIRYFIDDEALSKSAYQENEAESNTDSGSKPRKEASSSMKNMELTDIKPQEDLGRLPLAENTYKKKPESEVESHKEKDLPNQSNRASGDRTATQGFVDMKYMNGKPSLRDSIASVSDTASLATTDIVDVRSLSQDSADSRLSCPNAPTPDVSPETVSRSRRTSLVQLAKQTTAKNKRDSSGGSTDLGRFESIRTERTGSSSSDAKRYSLVKLAVGVSTTRKSEVVLTGSLQKMVAESDHIHTVNPFAAAAEFDAMNENEGRVPRLIRKASGKRSKSPYGSRSPSASNTPRTSEACDSFVLSEHLEEELDRRNKEDTCFSSFGKYMNCLWINIFDIAF